MPFTDRIAEADRLRAEIAGQSTLTGEGLQRFRDEWRLRLIWSSLALEGTVLSEVETRAVVGDGRVSGDRPLREEQEALGQAEAFDHLQRLLLRPVLTEPEIRKLHRLLLWRVDPARAGRYRRRTLVIPGSATVFPAPRELREQMSAFVAELPARRAAVHPIVYAAHLHQRLLTIHPFLDGNGRTARLLMNLALLQAGYPGTVLPPARRDDYLAAIRAGDAGNPESFVKFLAATTCASEEEYLRRLALEQGRGGR